MTTILKAETKKFRNMFTLLALSKSDESVFNPVVIEIVKQDGEDGYIQMQATNTTHTVATMQKHRNIEIGHEGENFIPVNTAEILDALKLFDDGVIIEIVFEEANTFIRDTENVKMKDEIKIPSLHIEAIESYDSKAPFNVDSKGVIELKNKATGKILEFDITATIPAEFVKAQIKRANFAKVTPRLFSLNFNETELKLIVGDDDDIYSKAVTLTVEIEGKGTGSTMFGDGYEAIFESLDGDVLFMGSNGSPAWITQKTDDHIVQFLLAAVV